MDAIDFYEVLGKRKGGGVTDQSGGYAMDQSGGCVVAQLRKELWFVAVELDVRLRRQKLVTVEQLFLLADGILGVHVAVNVAQVFFLLRV